MTNDFKPASHLVLGLWPIAGITTIGVTRRDAQETIKAAIDSGIDTFDTAYSYGFDGESDRLLGECVSSRRDRFHVMGKVGQRWTADANRVVDASPKQLLADARESLQRSELGFFDTLYLHSPDPNVPLGESASAMQELVDTGLCKRVGICNMNEAQLIEFASYVAVDAIQCPLNLIQRETFAGLKSALGNVEAKAFVFWSLMKGLLAGKMTRDHQFAEGDSRPGYPIFQGELRSAIHDVLDRMRAIGEETNQTIAQLSVGWSLSQPGVQGVLVGARRPEQIRETAATKILCQETLHRIEQIAAPAVKLASR